MSDTAADMLVRAYHALAEGMNGSRAFVHMTIQSLQQHVKNNLESQGKSIDCRGCNAFDVGPMKLTVVSLSPEGVFTTKDPHCFDQARPDRREHPVAVTFANVPPHLAAAGVVEGAPL